MVAGRVDGLHGLVEGRDVFLAAEEAEEVRGEILAVALREVVSMISSHVVVDESRDVFLGIVDDADGRRILERRVEELLPGARMAARVPRVGGASRGSRRARPATADALLFLPSGRGSRETPGVRTLEETP